MIEYLAVFGLGAVVTAVVQAFLAHLHDRKRLIFEEKKEAYIGLLEAYQNVAILSTDKARKEFAYWQMRCNLVGGKRVRLAINFLIESNEDLVLRRQAHDQLNEVIREDMGIAK